MQSRLRAASIVVLTAIVGCGETQFGGQGSKAPQRQRTEVSTPADTPESVPAPDAVRNGVRPEEPQKPAALPKKTDRPTTSVLGEEKGPPKTEAGIESEPKVEEGDGLENPASPEGTRPYEVVACCGLPEEAPHAPSDPSPVPEVPLPVPAIPTPAPAAPSPGAVKPAAGPKCGINHYVWNGPFQCHLPVQSAGGVWEAAFWDPGADLVGEMLALPMLERMAFAWDQCHQRCQELGLATIPL